MAQDKSARYAALQADDRALESVSSCEKSETTTISRLCINRALIRQWRCPWAAQVRNANPATIYEKPRRGTM